MESGKIHPLIRMTVPPLNLTIMFLVTPREMACLPIPLIKLRSFVPATIPLLCRRVVTCVRRLPRVPSRGWTSTI